MDSGGPETERLIAAAAALAPLVAEHRAALARGPDLPTPIAEALHAAGLTRLWLPRALGGPELPPADYIRVIEAVARLDGAVGWCAAIAASGARLAGLLPPEAAASMFGPKRRGLSGSLNPAGTAVPVENGFRVSGRWNWGSFIRYSEWTLGMCLTRSVEGPPTLLAAIAPTAGITIHDTWDAGGLRATGSHDFEFADVFVPSERPIPLPGFAAVPCDPGPLYRLPFVTVFTLGITPVALGIARAAIDALVAMAQRKTPVGTTAALREQPGVQRDVAVAEAKLRSARAFLLDAVGAFWMAAQRGETADMRLRAEVRLACWNAADSSRQVVSLMYEAAGGSAVDNRQPFAACLRDVIAAGQHLAFAQRNLEVVGRVMLGMEAGTARF